MWVRLRPERAIPLYVASAFRRKENSSGDRRDLIMTAKFESRLAATTAAVIIVVTGLAIETGGAQNAAFGADPARIRVINVAQRGGPPTGPFPVAIEHDQTLATH